LHARLLSVLCGAAATCGGAAGTALRAADLPDDGLLEFLGSVDSEDGGWHDYLARTDIDQIARRAAPRPAAPPAGAPGPPGGAPPPQDTPVRPADPVTPP
jgi:hypothetical protein